MANETPRAAQPTRVFALVVGCLLLLPALGALAGGVGLGLGYAFGRDDEGFFEVDLDRVESPTAAVTTEEVDFAADPGTPRWVIDALDADVRLRVENRRSDEPVFVGVGPAAAVEEYLAGVAHDEVRDLRDRTPQYRTRSGGDEATPPTDEDFWVAAATGVGSQELVWPATSGRWVAVVMNADGAPGIAADVNVGVKAGVVLPLAGILVALGVVGSAFSVALIVFGAHGLGRPSSEQSEGALQPDQDTVPLATPVRVAGHLDPELSRWRWLVKWFLAIPHFVVLFFLWLAFVVLTVVAGFSILFTGRYPQQIFAFNVGVMRWSWRVSFYATTGGIGTDRYPPFSLHPDPSYPASLDVEPPGELSRGLVLVKWWLLAIPHYLVVAALAGGVFWSTAGDDAARIGDGGLLGILVLVAGVSLLFRNRYPTPLFDLIVGLNRWIFRVVAYAGLMTDRYPPFRLDQGPEEPVGPLPGPADERTP